MPTDLYFEVPLSDGLGRFRKPWGVDVRSAYPGNEVLNTAIDTFLTRELSKFVKAREKQGVTGSDLIRAIRDWKPGTSTAKPKPSEAEKLVTALKKLPPDERREILAALEKEKGTT